MRRLKLISQLWIQYSDNASVAQQSSGVLKRETKSTENLIQMKNNSSPPPPCVSGSELCPTHLDSRFDVLAMVCGETLAKN